MALHELATNAGKYGSLSDDQAASPSIGGSRTANSASAGSSTTVRT